MGTVGSKSPLERRNTVARRSQRRTLHNLKPKVETLHKNIKKFKGTSEDVNYVALQNEIEYFKNDLVRRAKDLQPQVRNLYENVYKRTCEAEEALKNKLAENKEKQEKKDSKQKDDGATSIVSNSEVLSDVNNEIDTVVDVHTEGNQEAQEEEPPAENNHFKKVVELNIIKFASEEDVSKSPKEVRVISPMEKRKSILKVGVPVMPNVIMNELAAQTNRIAHQQIAPQQKTLQDVLDRINVIVECLRQIELEINEFIGKKGGKQYNKIKDGLNKYLAEVTGLSPVDDYVIDQINVCKNYISSCLSFLEERATGDVRPESFTSDDEVFHNNHEPAMVRVEENFRMQRLLKNTAV
ncbi:uncharacterized protein LOC126738368 [Anthonomus grandis grandis]|uniref:uncharacterized protein LOC126738368 n=1 Tax=Anthonomus grandis grandis TaxID=2921223 RepID=UPI0021669912|nr:uncharacterized protein LOC126738368 [Anthonomus grandis grandis]